MLVIPISIMNDLFQHKQRDSYMTDQNNQPIVHCNEFLAARLPDAQTILAVLLEALPLELWANTRRIHIMQTHSHVPTKPNLRIVCLRCRLLDAAGQELEEDESWYLTAYGWDKSFVAARAVHHPQIG